MNLIRKTADPFRADVLRGERPIFNGEIIDTGVIGAWQCEDGRRENRGDEWTDHRCQLDENHEGKHQEGDLSWE